MKRRSLKETIHTRRRAYTGKVVHLAADTITLPNGKQALREYLEHPGAVAVLAFVSKDKVVLVRQYRYPVGEVTYELPAGKIDAGEDPLNCVQRELREETGYTAKKVKKMLSFWPTAAFSNEVIHLYQAQCATQHASSPDDDEFLEAVTIPFSTVLKWVQQGKIRDSKTIIAVLFWQAYQRKKKQ